MKSIEIWRQIFAAISSNFIGFSFGWSCSWGNANFLDIQSPNTSLPDGPITYDEATLVTSLVFVGCLIGNVTYLWALSKFGRKSVVYFLGFPCFSSWICIIFAKNAYWLYVSRIFTGFFGGAFFLSSPIFVSEICSDSIRGAINAMGFLMCSLGSLTAFIFAMFVDFRMQAIYALSIPLLFAFVFYFVPETPAYLYSKNKIELADLSNEFYKGVKGAPESEKFVAQKKCDESKNGLSFSDFFGVRTARRAVIISFWLVVLPQLCGIWVLLSYTTAFFAEAGSSLTPLQSSTLICIVQLAASLFTMFLIDRLGRKIIFTFSAFGTGLGMLVLAMHRMYRDQLPDSNWVPMYGLSVTVFVGSLGILPVPAIISIDVLPPNIRNVAMTISSMLTWTLACGSNIAYLYLLPHIQLHGCLLVFTAGCFVSALYGLLFIPETKGKSYDTVAKLLS